ncbi:DUF4365 domain-containing protein [Nocardia sp. NPDC006044]|uniref:DUF4365 domain-containing protein n=1 Tax=Nocardia sp. NPDC006044 TaxID=3364306 RepID=UPI0036A5C4E6
MTGQWALGEKEHQGLYGESFVQALAAAAGLQTARPYPDCTGIDYQLTLPSERDDDFPRMEVQVKSWSKPKQANGCWQYRGLTEKQFNALAGKRRVPRFLFLVIVPDSSSGYTVAAESGLMLARAAYWQSFENEDRVPNPSQLRRRKVLVPETHLLSVRTLLDLFDPLRELGRP